MQAAASYARSRAAATVGPGRRHRDHPSAVGHDRRHLRRGCRRGRAARPRRAAAASRPAIDVAGARARAGSPRTRARRRRTRRRASTTGVSMLPDCRLVAVHVEVGLEPRHDHLALGIAEPDVVLDDLRPVGSDHRARNTGRRGTRRRARGSSASVGQIARSITSSTMSSARTAPASTRPCRRCSGPCRRRTRACGPAQPRTVRASVPSHSTKTDSSGPVMPFLDHAGAARVAERVAREIRAHRVTRVDRSTR